MCSFDTSAADNVGKSMVFDTSGTDSEGDMLDLHKGLTVDRMVGNRVLVEFLFKHSACLIALCSFVR